MNNSNKKKKFLNGKGYYIALILCLAAVGVSSYVFLTANHQAAQSKESLSVPLKPEQPPKSAAKAVSAPVAEADGDEQVRKIAEQLKVSPVKGDILQPFSTEALSYNETTKDWRLHPAVDIAAEGQTVMAAMAGKVKDVYEDDSFGTTVVLTHEGGYETRYSNLTAMPTVKAGDTVRAGDVLGAVGDTAISETAMEPHLHFQVLKDGNPVDPAEFLQ